MIASLSHSTLQIQVVTLSFLFPLLLQLIGGGEGDLPPHELLDANGVIFARSSPLLSLLFTHRCSFAKEAINVFAF